MGIVWKHYGNTMGTRRECSGNTPGTAWEWHGNIRGLLWEQYENSIGNTMGMLWEYYIMNNVGPPWEQSGSTMGMLWEYHGALWEYSGNTMAMLRAYSRNTMGKPRSEMLRSCQQLSRMRGRGRAGGAAEDHWT